MPACPATPPRSRTSSLCWHTRCAAASCLALLLVASFTVSCTGDLHNNTSAIDAACRAQRFLYGAEGLSPKEKAKMQQEILDIIFAKGEPSASRPPSLPNNVAQAALHSLAQTEQQLVPAALCKRFSRLMQFGQCCTR